MRTSWIPWFSFCIACASSPPRPQLPDAELIRIASHVEARRLLAPIGGPPKEPKVALEGTVEDYVKAVVGRNATGKVTRAAVVRCQRDRSQRCVELIGEACPGEAASDPRCDGLSLTVVVDVSGATPRLDHARSSRGPVRDQLDIEAQLAGLP